MLRDIRRAPFCWQDKATLRALRAYYDGDRRARRATALAIYLVLTELASDQHSQMHVETTHRAIWEATGTSEATVKRYLREFEDIGLVAIERRKVHADISLPNIYALLTPGFAGDPTPVTGVPSPGVAGDPTPRTGEHHNEQLPLTKDEEEEDRRFARRFARKYGLSRERERALVASHTGPDGRLNRGAYLAAATPAPARR